VKPVLILEHQIPENIAYLGTWLIKNNIKFRVFNAEKDKEFPNNIEAYSALAVMGGAMSANDMLFTNKKAEILILQAMYRDIPVLGHCLGGQLMAKALGAKITVNGVPEIGWQKISYNIADPLVTEWFRDNPTDYVIHWHYDTFEIPTGAKRLATTEACSNQVFVIDKHIGMQFHIEIDQKKLDFWVTNKDENWQKAIEKYKTVQDKNEMLIGAEKYLLQHQKTADAIYSKWLSKTEYGHML